LKKHFQINSNLFLTDIFDSNIKLLDQLEITHRTDVIATTQKQKP